MVCKTPACLALLPELAFINARAVYNFMNTYLTH